MALIQVELHRNWLNEDGRQFTIQSDVDWLSPDAGGEFSVGGQTVTFEITTFANDTGDSRSGSILIQSNPEGLWDAHLDVEQDSGSREVTVSPSSLSLNADGTAN